MQERRLSAEQGHLSGSLFYLLDCLFQPEHHAPWRSARVIDMNANSAVILGEKPVKHGTPTLTESVRTGLHRDMRGACLRRLQQDLHVSGSDDTDVCSLGD